jgi:hypothetical protein
VAVVFAIVFFNSSRAAATMSFEKGTQLEPPYGLAIQGNASGDRLIGEVSIENHLYYGDYATDLTAVVRLRKGTSNDTKNNTNTFWTFYKDLSCSTNLYGLPCTYYVGTCYDVNDVSAIQTAITNAFKDAILGFFFPGDTNRNLVLRAVDDYGWTYSDDYLSLIGLGDIELASKKY